MAQRYTQRTDSQPPDDRTYSPEVTSFEQSPGSSQFRGAGRSLPVAYLPIIKENSPSVKREFDVFYENSRFFRFSVFFIFSLCPRPAPPSAARYDWGTGGPMAAPTGYLAGRRSVGAGLCPGPSPESTENPKKREGTNPLPYGMSRRVKQTGAPRWWWTPPPRPCRHGCASGFLRCPLCFFVLLNSSVGFKIFKQQQRLGVAFFRRKVYNNIS